MKLIVRIKAIHALALLLVLCAALPGLVSAQNGGRNVGDRILMSASRCPNGSMVAAGQELHINFHHGLFYAIGSRYGGDGRSTFALPDLRLGPLHGCIISDPDFVAPRRYIGEVFEANGQCPQGSLPADGRAVAIDQAEALFSLIGSRYGGDARSVFHLPSVNGGRPFYCVAVAGQYP